MNRYKFYCTDEQTKKALELGAPIEVNSQFDSYDIRETDIFYKDKFIELSDGRLAEYCTVEEMVGWMEDHYPIKVDVISLDNGYDWTVCKKTETDLILIAVPDKTCFSRNEAALASIDAALEYLTNKK